jgi:hypothetical protein
MCDGIIFNYIIVILTEIQNLNGLILNRTDVLLMRNVIELNWWSTERRIKHAVRYSTWWCVKQDMPQRINQNVNQNDIRLRESSARLNGEKSITTL